MSIQKSIGGSVGSSLVSSFNHSLTSINEDHELSGEQMELLELGSKVSPRRGKRPKGKDDNPPKAPQQKSASAPFNTKQKNNAPSLIGPNEDDDSDEEKENTQDELIAYSSSISGGSSGDSGSFIHKGRTIEMPDVRPDESGAHFLQLDFMSQSSGHVHFADNKVVNIAAEQEEERLVNALRRPPKTVARKGQRRPDHRSSEKVNKKLTGYALSKGRNEVPDFREDANFLQLDFASMAGQVQYSDNTMVNQAAEREEEDMPALDDVKEDDVQKRKPRHKRSPSSRRKQQRVPSPPLQPQGGRLGDQPGRTSVTNDLFRSSQAGSSSGHSGRERQDGNNNDTGKSDGANPMDRLWQFGASGRNLLAHTSMEESFHFRDGAESVISQHSY
jgi:hypothetical protein